jgi:histone acetyltransferase (RNA polymerase elongator complex component)
MRYIGNIYRPPSEAYSLIVQVTVGCAHNECTFCSMFKDKSFYVRPVEDVIEDLEDARRTYRRVDRMFLADGDALVLSMDRLEKLLTKIYELFPELERVTIYGSPQDVLKKSPEDLKRLKELGIDIIYIGAESGSDKVLEAVRKGVTAAELTAAIKRIEDSGIKSSVTFISGLGGADGWEDHAVQTGLMITDAQPADAALLTLLVDPDAPLYNDVQEGRFKMLSPEGIVDETILLLENAAPEKDVIFRSNHASNYISLKGTLPADRERMLGELKAVQGHSEMLKDDRFRLL